MIGKSVPVYFYENNTTQIGVGSFTILMDTAIVEKYINTPYNTVIQEWSGITMTNLKVVNNYLGIPLINKQMVFYTKLDPGNSLPHWGVQVMDTLGLAYSGVNMNTASDNVNFKNIVGSVYQDQMPGVFWDTGHSPPISVLTRGSAVLHGVIIDDRDNSFSIAIRVIREDAFNADGDLVKGDNIDFHIEGHFSNDYSTITDAKLRVRAAESGVGAWSPTFNLNNSQAKDSDINNPWEDDDNNGGDGDNRPAEVDPTDIPPLPDVGAADLGLVTLYAPTKAQLQALGNFLWSGLFDPDTYKKVFTDPMDCLIGLAIVPALPATQGNKNIQFGNCDSGVNSAFLSTQYVSVNCGSVKIPKKNGDFLDYQTKISIYLPYIGFRELSADDVMGASLQVVYNIDVLTGACAAFIKHSSRGVMYAYNGSCITNVALSGANYSGAIQNAVSTVASGVGVLAGMASGAAPVTLMSATSMLSSAANTALNSKPSIQRSGNLGGSAGILSVQKPFIIIQRPNPSVPSYMQNYVGRVCNKTASLGACNGFTMVDYCHLDGISATPGEITEIETMLKSGVIL